MATGFGNWANTVKVHTVLKQIAQNEIERLRPASRLAEVTKIDSDAKTLLVKFVGETNEVIVPFTSVAPSNVGQWVRVGGTTHDRHVEDVIGTTDSESRLADTENHVNQLMTSILGESGPRMTTARVTRSSIRSMVSSVVSVEMSRACRS